MKMIILIALAVFLALLIFLFVHKRKISFEKMQPCSEVGLYSKDGKLLMEQGCDMQIRGLVHVPEGDYFFGFSTEAGKEKRSN